MLEIQQLKMPVGHTEEDLQAELCRKLRLQSGQFTYTITKKSIDARKKNEPFFVYAVQLQAADRKLEQKLSRQKQVAQVKRPVYQFPAKGTKRLQKRPVIIGSGPAGLFCALFLAEQGYAPLLLERGDAVEERLKAVETFWRTGVLQPESNVQFGEGGAGTFSDGKLNTLVKDKTGRNRMVLETFVKYGAPEDILVWNKPHIGTDILVDVVRNMRRAIIQAGGEVRFRSCVTEIEHKDGQLSALMINGQERLETETAVLAVGHSARDTFAMLLNKKVEMSAKAFAVGVRIEHPQDMIQQIRYGEVHGSQLPPADYKVAKTLDNGRGVYSFCMCPGGYVVNASSEPGRLAVNGMSYRDRAGKNANSAIIVSVTPEDFDGQDPLAGVRFQRMLEERAYACAGGAVPIQLFGDFCAGRVSRAPGAVQPATKGSHAWGDVRGCFPEEIAASIEEGIRQSARQIRGFDRADAVLSGVESRTSSPVRIHRDEHFESNIAGIYPCGEGAGYAGGITSAAMDGIKTAEAVMRRYASES